MELNALLGRLAYGAVFCALGPALLAALAIRLDDSGMGFWPQPFPGWAGAAAIAVAAALMAASIWALWHDGQGLPMNAYPPRYFVTSSTYALFAHPIYVAFVLAVVGASALANSAAGVWLVAPLAALAATGLVAGYEAPRLAERFGARHLAPLFGVPVGGETRPTLGRRIAAGLTALGPWALGYAVLSRMPSPEQAIDLRAAWEERLPRPEFAIWLYTLAYGLVAASPLLIRSTASLRRFVLGAWLMTGVGFLVMLTLPGKAAFLPIDDPGAAAWLVSANRRFDAEWLALPSFHTAWVVFAAYALSDSVPRLRVMWWSLAIGISASCVLTGSHAVLDVFAGVALGVFGWHYDACWRLLLRIAERLSNSWAALELGPVRIISHALWSFAAAALGTLLVLWLAGRAALWLAPLVIVTGLVSAGVWGYWFEGGHRLSRPFGYYGYIIGALASLAMIAIAGVPQSGALSAAFAAAAPLVQAVGRLRCLVQGCCHGRPAPVGRGIRVTHPHSRVTALGQLAGVPIHPTQLYSIVGNAAVTLVLLRLWNTDAPWPVIFGLYLVLTSLARFIEERYRGEPQTAHWGGLASYQWLALAFFLLGTAFMMMHGTPVSAARTFSSATIAEAIAAGIAAAVCMSVDFPRSSRPLSRLTVTSP